MGRILGVLWLASLLIAVALAARIPEKLSLNAAKDEEPNERPIIGILSQPGDPAPNGMSYIAASYVKWVESAGARVIPIYYDMDEEEVRRRFNIINGLLLPGGGATLSPGHKFYDTATLLVGMAMKANDDGDYFPVHGTCLGMETLSIIISQNYTILSDFDGEDAAAPLMYTDVARESQLYKGLPKDVVKALQTTPIAMENHMKGLSMQSYEANPRLREFFRVISLSLDKVGAPYVSTMEAWRYPITAVQWHPEKNNYEWTTSLHIPHTREAIRMSQEIANFFVAEARRNMHRPASQVEEDDLLIYNHNPTFTGKHKHAGEETDFEQSYFFEKANKLKPPKPNSGAVGSSATATATAGSMMMGDGMGMMGDGMGMMVAGGEAQRSTPRCFMGRMRQWMEGARAWLAAFV